MIRFRDFVPKMLAPPGWFKEGDYESLEATVNARIAESKVRVISVETVVLPNIWSRFEEGSTDTALSTSGDSPSRWHQIVRCWYQAEGNDECRTTQ